MFCRKILYSKIHYKTLEVTYESNNPNDNLLLQSKMVSVHQRHLRFLMTEIYKSISQLKPEFTWSYFRGSLMWNDLVDVVKSSDSLFEFKTKIMEILIADV